MIDGELSDAGREVKKNLNNLSDFDLRHLATVFTLELDNRDKAAKQRAREKIKQLAAEAGISVIVQDAVPKKKTGTKPGTIARIKYRDDSGNTWSGRGREPKWIQNLVKSGKNLDDFLTPEFKPIQE